MLLLDFEPFPIITTDRLVLRQVNNGDANEIYALRSDKQVMKFIDKPLDKTIKEAMHRIKLISDSLKTSDGITWAITLKGNLKLIGTIGFWKIDKVNYRAEIGFLLHPSFQKKGIMQEAMSEVITFGFDKLKFHSIEANVNPNNKDSIKLLERNKFIREAYFRENYFYDGKFLDSVIYSLLTNC